MLGDALGGSVADWRKKTKKNKIKNKLFELTNHNFAIYKYPRAHTNHCEMYGL